LGKRNECQCPIQIGQQEKGHGRRNKEDCGLDQECTHQHSGHCEENVEWRDTHKRGTRIDDQKDITRIGVRKMKKKTSIYIEESIIDQIKGKCSIGKLLEELIKDKILLSVLIDRANKE